MWISIYGNVVIVNINIVLSNFICTKAAIKSMSVYLRNLKRNLITLVFDASRYVTRTCPKGCNIKKGFFVDSRLFQRFSMCFYFTRVTYLLHKNFLMLEY